MRRLRLFGRTDTGQQIKRRLSVKAILYSSVLLLAGTCLLAGYLQRDQLRTDFHHYAAAQGFQPKTIEIKGRSHTDKNDILAIVSPLKDKSILSIDMQALRSSITRLGWVEDAIIIRTLPDQLEIRLKERQPVALLQTAGGHSLIDENGTVINGADAAEFSHLVVVSGRNAAKGASVILDILRTEPELFSDVWAAQHISERRWNVHLRSGLVIKLPEQDPLIAWSRLATIEQKTAITQRDLAAIDLRVPGQLIVEPNIPVRGKGSKT